MYWGERYCSKSTHLLKWFIMEFTKPSIMRSIVVCSNYNNNWDTNNSNRSDSRRNQFMVQHFALFDFVINISVFYFVGINLVNKYLMTFVIKLFLKEEIELICVWSLPDIEYRTLCDHILLCWKLLYFHTWRVFHKYHNKTMFKTQHQIPISLITE